MKALVALRHIEISRVVMWAMHDEWYIVVDVS